MKLYIIAAQGYMMLGVKKSLWKFLKNTRNLSPVIFTHAAKRRRIFNLIDQWIEELDLGNALPRDEKIIRKSMADGVINNPAFTILADEIRFRRIAEN